MYNDGPWRWVILTKNTQYRSTIKSRPFFYMETKKLTDLILQGLNDYEIKEKVVSENVLQSTSIARRKEVAAVILKRLHILDEFLLNHILNNTVETSKSIVLYSIIKTDRLFYEFIHEVLYEKMLIRNFLLKDTDLDNYFETKKVQSEIVASWQPYTFYKLKQVYKRILFEAGLLHHDNKHHNIVIPIIDPAVIDHIKQIDHTSFIPIVLGGGK